MLCIKSQVFANHHTYRDAWSKAFREDPPIPLNVDLELASLCNLACPYCFWGEDDFNAKMREKGWDGIVKKRFMPTDLAKKIIDECSALGVPAIKINWRGESTLHPDFTEIVRYASNKTPRFHDLLINTNGNCPPQAIDGLSLATKVMISLDSLDPTTYPKMRVRGNLTNALNTVYALSARSHPNLWVRRVITKVNRDEDFVGKARSLFGPGVHVSEHFCFDRNVDEHHQMNDPVLAEKFDRTYCGYPSQRIMVSSSGLCYPCCVDYDETMPIGNVYKQTLGEIWHGDAMQNLRKTLRANNTEAMSKTCQNCTSWMAYARPERDFVQDKEATS